MKKKFKQHLINCLKSSNIASFLSWNKIIESIKSYKFSVSGNNKWYIIKLLDFADIDLKISEILLEKLEKNEKLKFGILYHLQQSSEKLLKSYALLFGIISINELKKIGHNALNLFYKIDKKMDICQFFKDNENNAFGKVLKRIRNLIRDKKDWQKDLKNFLINMSSNKFKRIFKYFHKLKKKSTKLSKRKINFLLECLKINRVDGVEIKSKEIERFLRYIFSILWLYYISFLLFPFNELGRYPPLDSELNIEKKQLFKQLSINEREIIKELKELIKNLREDLNE